MPLNIKKVVCDGVLEEELFSALKSRSQKNEAEVETVVRDIIENVLKDGDSAVLGYTERFDGARPDSLEVSRDEINEALDRADERLIHALLTAQENITEYHNRQKRESIIDFHRDGVILGQRVRGLKRVGLYVPGGTAAYPSTVLMNAIPAKIAGVEELIMVTPPGRDGKPNQDILAAAAICGVDRVFLAGGAQAVAALAYGTKTIPQVDKIVGPGNIYVATAKKLLFGVVDIDMIAGPSEILVIADEGATPSYIAADLLSQAEHDRLASSILVTTSSAIADETINELNIQLKKLSRSDIATTSLENYGAVIVAESRARMVELANRIAPEHLEVMCKNPMELVGSLDNAGSIFLGDYSPEPLGDYYAGPNHVLPTSGTARFFSPLSVDSFLKRTSFISYTRSALLEAGADIIKIAESEGLTAHAEAVNIRMKSE